MHLGSMSQIMTNNIKPISGTFMYVNLFSRLSELKKDYLFVSFVSTSW